MMEVRVARWMSQGPVGEPAVVFLDHRGECQAQCRCLAERSKTLEVHGRGQLESIAAAANLQPGCPLESGSTHAGAVVIEAIRRPIERGREVELVVARASRCSGEGLEACMSPQTIGAAAGTGVREPQARGVATQRVAAGEAGAGGELRFGRNA